MAKVTSCGVLVTDGRRLLLGHATHSPRWDIPKGVAEPGEDFAVAAARELDEETGLLVPTNALRDLGVHLYLPGKDLALFVWMPEAMPMRNGWCAGPRSHCPPARACRSSTGSVCSAGMMHCVRSARTWRAC